LRRTNQLAMPTEQGVGLHKEPMELRLGEQPTKAGKERSVPRPQNRTVQLATGDPHLVQEYDDFGQIRFVGPLEPEDRDGPEEGEIEE
jgi:hypothetical protein